MQKRKSEKIQCKNIREKKAKEAKNYTEALREVQCSLEVNTAKYIRSSHLSTS